MQSGRSVRIPSSDRQHKQQLIAQLASRRQHQYIEDSDSSSEASEAVDEESEESASEAPVVDLSESSSSKVLPGQQRSAGATSLSLRPQAPKQQPSPAASPVVPTPQDSPGASEQSCADDLVLLLASASSRAVTLGHELAGRLYAHQVTGLKWLASLYGRRRGGILGDDMGLGKVSTPPFILYGLLQAHERPLQASCWPLRMPAPHALMKCVIDIC